MNAQQTIDDLNAPRERAAAHARAINARKASREAAALISDSLAEGQDGKTESEIAAQQTELVGNAAVELAYFVGPDEGDDWLQGLMSGGICYTLYRALNNNEMRSKDQARYLLRLCQQHRGSDIDDDRIQRATEFMQRLQATHAKLEAALQGAKNAHETLTGQGWVPFTPGQPVEVKARTAAARDAMTMIAPYLKGAGGNDRKANVPMHQRLSNEQRVRSYNWSVRQQGSSGAARTAGEHPAFDDEIPL